MDVQKLEKAIKIIKILYKLLFVIGIVGGVLYILINFVSPSLSMTEINGAIVKDTSFIIITSSFIWAPCLVFGICLKTLSANLSNVQIDQNCEEQSATK